MSGVHRLPPPRVPDASRCTYCRVVVEVTDTIGRIYYDPATGQPSEIVCAPCAYKYREGPRS